MELESLLESKTYPNNPTSVVIFDKIATHFNKNYTGRKSMIKGQRNFY